MVALEKAMKSGPVDVFWFQERWKVYVDAGYPLRNWLGKELPPEAGTKTHRALLWLVDISPTWVLPDEWKHGDLTYEIAIGPGGKVPSWVAPDAILHTVPADVDRAAIARSISAIDMSSVLPIDYILTCGASSALVKAAARESIPLVSLPPA
jgi:hypothetical protein